ncbi:MAG TPA: acyl-CoA dehydrogenase family protein [Acidimicrobiales bacterium]|nr:acyl-CoA dehydrogenase family protein [Acidimicrobiales bacterium]
MTAATTAPPAGPVLGLSPEQEELERAVLQFAVRELAPHAVAWDRQQHFPADVLRHAARLGLGGVVVDPDAGGAGLSRLDAVVVFEALATGCPSLAAYVSIHNMVAAMVDRFGSASQRETHLPALCSMDHFGSYCLTEADAGSDAAALRTTALRRGEGWVIDGVKQFVSGAGTSDLYVVMARTGDAGPSGVTAFLVEAGMAGLSFGAEEQKMGWRAQPTRQVVLEGVEVPDEARLGPEGEGFKVAMAGLDGGRLNIAACSIGGASLALEKARAHLLDRRAFGRPLADQQALRFVLADMATELEAARLMVRRAATALDAGAADATQWCAMAKRFATDAGFTVANQALQLHGGYGYLAETGIEKIVRDLRVHQILEGTNEIMRLIVSRHLLGNPS